MELGVQASVLAAALFALFWPGTVQTSENGMHNCLVLSLSHPIKRAMLAVKYLHSKFRQQQGTPLHIILVYNGCVQSRFQLYILEASKCVPSKT